jgi:hypothetical protein
MFNHVAKRQAIARFVENTPVLQPFSTSFHHQEILEDSPVRSCMLVPKSDRLIRPSKQRFVLGCKNLRPCGNVDQLAKGTNRWPAPVPELKYLKHCLRVYLAGKPARAADAHPHMLPALDRPLVRPSN